MHPLLMNSKRILVIGCPGSGKSTLSRKLSQKSKLSVLHLDTYYWKANWQEPSEAEWRSTANELCKQAEWIMDGNYHSTYDLRFPVADLIIFLDQPRLLCIKRALFRIVQYSKKITRPDMAVGCHESFDWSFYKYIWNFNRDIRPKTYAASEKYNCSKKLIVLKNDREIDAFLSA